MSKVTDTEARMLERGDAVPHFEVNTVEGLRFSYSTIWQNRSLVLVVLPPGDSESTRRFVAELSARMDAIRRQHAECVITREAVPGVSGPAVLVADRWGEIVYVARRSDVSGLPQPGELVEWITYVQNQCPECEGEAR